jgi:putative copper export protein
MLAVRLLHVLAMALAVGGAVAVWWLARRSVVGESAVETDAAVEIAGVYEAGFWAAAGLLVMTGVGNLGSLAPAVPPAETYWGTVFAVKLLLVVGLLAFSLVRTLAVVRCRKMEFATATSAPTRTLRVGYGATAVSLALLVALAEVLAHG